MDELGAEGTPVNMSTFDALIDAFYHRVGTPEAQQAYVAISDFCERPDSWLLAPSIIRQSAQESSKFVALHIFVSGVRRYWNSGGDDSQRESLRQFVFGLCIEWSHENTSHILQSASNKALIEILKSEWPGKWPTFMSDLLTACAGKVNSSGVGLDILKIIGEEAHDFFDDTLALVQQSRLARAVEGDIGFIFSFLTTVLAESQNADVIEKALLTVAQYLKWVDMGMIVSSKYLANVVRTLFPVMRFRYGLFKCFDGIATNRAVVMDQHIQDVFDMFIETVKGSVAPEQDITEVYRDDRDRMALVDAFGHYFLLGSAGLLHGILTENSLLALAWLVQLTAVSDRDIFINACETWNDLCRVFFRSQHRVHAPEGLIYQLQQIYTHKMVPPPEIFELVQCGDDSEDDTALFRTMEETISCLASVASENMAKILMGTLSSRNLKALLPVLYTIGAISGAFTEAQEQEFITRVSNIIIELFDMKMSDSEQAILCGCYMYVMSRYPRFLVNNWACAVDLSTKLMEFMRAPFISLRLAAVSVMDSLVARCPMLFVTLPPSGRRPLICDWLERLPEFVPPALEPQAIPVLYGSLASLVQTHRVPEEKKQMLSALLAFPVRHWQETLRHLGPGTSCNAEISRRVIFVISILSKILVISSEAVTGQIDELMAKTQELFTFYASEVMRLCAHPHVTRCKGCILELYASFFEVHADAPIVPMIVRMIAQDYFSSPREARLSQSIDCFTSLVKTLEGRCDAYSAEIIEAIMKPTMIMITEMSSDLVPDIFVSYFRLIAAFMEKVKPAFVSMDIDSFSRILGNILSGVSHAHTYVSSWALICLRSLLSDLNIKGDPGAQRAFYDRFYQEIVIALLKVVLNQGHKFLFQELVETLQHLFVIIHTRTVFIGGREDTEPLVCEAISTRLRADLAEIGDREIYAFIMALCHESQQSGTFQSIIRDFLANVRPVPRPGDHFEDEQDVLEIPGMTDVHESVGDASDEISEF